RAALRAGHLLRARASTASAHPHRRGREGDATAAHGAVRHCDDRRSRNRSRGGRYTMNAAASVTITPVRVADLLAEGDRMPVYVHVIDHPDARVLVDTGMT